MSNVLTIGIQGPPGPGGYTVVSINASQSPYSPTIPIIAIGVDVSAGPVTINLPANITACLVKNIAGLAANNPITVVAPTGIMIENLSPPSQTFGASATINVTGASIEWQLMGTKLAII